MLLSVVFVALLSCTGVLSATAGASAASRCNGVDRTVINSTTATVDGKTLQIETVTCPSIAAALPKLGISPPTTIGRDLAKRQGVLDQCGVVCNSGAECTDVFSTVIPSALDCISLGNALISLSEAFTVAPGVEQIFTLDTCAVAFANLFASGLSIEYCTLTLGSVVGALTDDCIEVEPVTGGACFPDTNFWGIEINGV